MKNYAEMSDFDINCLVASQIHPELELLNSNGECVIHHSFAYNQFFDPCNDPSDAWNIIFENKIDLKFGDDVDETLKGCCMAYNGTHSATHDNPLRAAMIVFLMMQNHD